MARNFTKADVSAWRLVSNLGKTLVDAKGVKLDQYKGFADAKADSYKFGGTPVRV